MRGSAGGSSHQGSTKKQPCLSHRGHRPRRTCLTRVDLHEVGDLLAPTNSLVQLHNLDEGSQVKPNQSRRHHSPKGNRWCVYDEPLALVFRMIVSPTLNSLARIWIWWKRRFEWKVPWGRLEIKIHSWNGITWSQHMSRWFFLRKCML